MLKCVGIIDFTNVPFDRDYRVGINGFKEPSYNLNLSVLREK